MPVRLTRRGLIGGAAALTAIKGFGALPRIGGAGKRYGLQRF